MLSTGNDIVSLNAINKTRTRQSAFYSKILSPVEKEIFNETVFARMPFESFVWLLWSAKESAYKYLQRITPNLIFSPTKFAVNHLEIPAGHTIKNFENTQTESIGFDDIKVIKATVTFDSDTLFLRSIIYKQLIFSVVDGTEGFENIGWGIKLIEESGPDYQSAAVRAFLIEKLSTLLKVTGLAIDKNTHGIPIVIKGSEESSIPVSLSHHGQLVAYSYNLSYAV